MVRRLNGWTRFASITIRMRVGAARTCTPVVDAVTSLPLYSLAFAATVAVELSGSYLFSVGARYVKL